MKQSSRRYTPGPRKYTIVYREEEEGGYSGHCLELPGAISQGETLDELKENIADAIRLIIEDIIEEVVDQVIEKYKIEERVTAKNKRNNLIEICV